MKDSEYRPDAWVILKILDEGGVFYKVLAGWSGSYLSGQSWKINSGITEIEERDEAYHLHGETGSVYVCRKKEEGLKMSIAEIWRLLEKTHGDKVELISYGQLIEEFK